MDSLLSFAALAFWAGSCIGVFVAWIFLVRSGFRESTALGFATLVFWPVSAFTLTKHWGVQGKDIRYPFFITLIGTMVFGGGFHVYRDFTLKAYVSEAQSFSSVPRKAVGIAYEKGLTLGALPSQTGLGLAAPASYSSKYVQSVTVDRKGVVTVLFTDHDKLGPVANGTVTYTPKVQDDRLVWVPACSFDNAWCPKR